MSEGSVIGARKKAELSKVCEWVEHQGSFFCDSAGVNIVNAEIHYRKGVWRRGRRNLTIDFIVSVSITLLLVTMIGSSCNALLSTRFYATTSRSLLRYSSRTAYHQHPLKSLAGSTTHEFSTFSADKASKVGANPQKGVVVSMKEIELSLADGMVVRGQHWSNSNSTKAETTKVLALHGWLDNCRSFHLLAPKLLEKSHQSIELVAVDLPGHGWSSHKPLAGPSIVLSEGVYYIAEMLDALGWGIESNNKDNKEGNDDNNNNNNKQISLIGHSMGGSLAVMYAGIFPEHVSKVVSIDIYGPESATIEKTASQMRSHVNLRRAMSKGKQHAIYPSLERAAERRQKTATLNPGRHQYISLEAATELVTRAMEPVYENDDNNDTVRGYKFKHDNRLLWPSIQYLTQDQIQCILEPVKCPVCILAAQDGYPFAKDRIERVISTLQPVHKTLPGSHHLHADPDTAEAVVDEICGFFDGEGKQ